MSVVQEDKDPPIAPGPRPRALRRQIHLMGLVVSDNGAEIRVDRLTGGRMTWRATGKKNKRGLMIFEQVT